MIVIRQPGFAIAAILALGSLAYATEPIIGPQVRVDVTGGPEWANETTASASELFPLRVVAGWNDHREGPGSRFGVALSFDGGRTWTDFLIRPPAAYEGDVEGDPMVAHDDRTGTLWAGAMSFWGGGGIYVARLEPGDTSFQPSVMAEHGLVDKGWMTAGLRYGFPQSTRLYCAYNLGLIWSDDMGETWTDPVGLGSGSGFLPRVGPNGEVYVSYWDWGSGVRLKRSLDGGHTITTHTIATRMDVWGVYDTDRFPGIFRVPSFTYLEVDPNSGALYALYFDTTNYVDGQANVDLYFTKSVDQGSSWSVPVVINGDADPPGDQFFPWMEVDREGRVHVVFLDSRNVVQDDDVPNGFFDAYYTYSDDGGHTWNEYRLTRDSWNSAGINFLGDYSGMAVAGNRVVPVYIQVEGGDPRIYANVIEFPADCPWDCAEPADDVVSVVDFLALLAQWGQAGTACDFDGSGVSVTDFLELLANWGPCP
ncbi:MAG: hypothetical protein ACYTGF_11275 [Planctomycetota bacterium]|jgi:hypothetical protein